MKIRVVEQIQLNGDTIVTFDSTVGVGRAVWRNDSPPKLAYDYDAEFDVDDPLEKIKVDIRSEDPKYSIVLNGDSVHLIGTIDSLDDDGMVYLRLSNDCLIMIESEKAAIKPGEWVALKLDIGSLEVTVQGG